MDDIPTKESIQANLIELRVLLTRLTSIGVLPANPEQPRYPFISYTPDPEWIDNIGSEAGALNRDLELLFPVEERFPSQDFTRLVRFHKSGPTLEAIVNN